MNSEHKFLRLLLGASCALCLLFFFLYQRTNVAGLLGIVHHDLVFIVNKGLRFLVNDFLMIGIIYALFAERKYVAFALWVQVFGFVFILIPYFILKLYFHTGNGPLISFLHRLVLNPTLLMLLVPALYYQRRKGA